MGVSELTGQRLSASDTFNRMFSANDGVSNFAGLPTELWVQIIEKQTEDYVVPSYAEHFPVNNSVGLGEIILYYTGRVGKGALIRAGQDWTRVGLTSEGSKINAHPYGAFIGEHWWDAMIRGELGAVASNMTPERQTAALIDVVNLTIDEAVYLGDPAVGKMGIKRNPFISRVTAPMRFDEAGDPYAIVRYITSVMRTASRLNETQMAPMRTTPNALLLPTDVMQLFNDRVYFASAGGTTTLSSIMEQLTAAGITYVGSSEHMSQVSSTNGKGALLYRREAGETAPVQVYQPLTLERLPIYWNGEENILKMFSVLHDIWFDYPDRTVLIEGI